MRLSQTIGSIDCAAWEDEPLWSLRRMLGGLRLWLWFEVLFPSVLPLGVGPMVFLKYHRRPCAQCVETRHC